jgi:ubiquinone biosynthesis protein
MLSALINTLRLARAGVYLAWHGVHVAPEGMIASGPVAVFRRITAPLRRAAGRAHLDQASRLSKALARLGPSYIKLGQFLATRPDVIGQELATDLSGLQDRLPPFPLAQARRIIETSLGQPIETLYASFSEPVAAASIAQVHRATVLEADGTLRPVAVKVLRPGVEARFRRDLKAFYFAARLIERVYPPSRRLRPIAVVDTLAQWVGLEMDLRMEASAMSEMAENIAKSGDVGFRAPKVDWARTSTNVLTQEWVGELSIADLAGIDAAGIDRQALGMLVIRSFLRHAMRDGFFHGDMHQGNLFVSRAGEITAVDFGIIGRLGAKERRFLAEILYGFIVHDYRRVAVVHFEAGYVPANQDVAAFAQALRAIGEPLKDRTAEEISMGRVLAQLFEVTEMFDMETRPELLLLQKTMVVVEGVARSLDPRINMWTAAEPVVRDWMERELGPGAKLRQAAEGAASLLGALAAAPKLAEQAARAGQPGSSGGIGGGLHLDDASIERLANAHARRSRGGRLALWVGALALVSIAVKIWLP